MEEEWKGIWGGNPPICCNCEGENIISPRIGNFCCLNVRFLIVVLYRYVTRGRAMINLMGLVVPILHRDFLVDFNAFSISSFNGFWLFTRVFFKKACILTFF
jgi:hypothetical protein